MMTFQTRRVVRPRTDGATSRSRPVLALAAVLWLCLFAGPAGARINLRNLGVNTNLKIGGTFDPTDPPPPSGGGGPNSVADLEKAGFTCEPGHVAAFECRACGVEPVSDTQTCVLRLCPRASDCTGTRYRWDIPRDVAVDQLRMWATEFAFGASSYFIADFDGDGRRDIGARFGSTVRAALSRGTYFEPQPGNWTGPFTVENDHLPGSADVNHDGLPDELSIDDGGNLTVGISSGASVASTVAVPETWCEQLGDCLVGDVDGDGLPDVVEIMRGAVAGHRTGDIWVSLGHAAPGFPPLPPPPASKDSDGDGILDGSDNCTEVANPSQTDADQDGFGNACDADLNNDGIVDPADVAILADCLGAKIARRPSCAPSDLDDNKKVSTADSAILTDALGTPPGPSGKRAAPRIELAAPADGTILPVGSTKVWVAGYVPDVPASALKVTVGGVPVPVSGPGNLFSTFVDLQAPTPAKLFQSIVIDAARGSVHTIERRVVIVGDHTRPGRRSHNAAGARLTASGLDRLEQFVREHIVPEIAAGFPDKVNGYRHDNDCAILGLGGPLTCWDGYDITNASVSAPVITVDFDGAALRIRIMIPRLEFDWRVDMQGPDCGDHATATNLTADLLYDVVIGAGGRVEVRELQEPSVTASFDISGCWGLGHSRVEQGITGIDGDGNVSGGLAGALNDPDDYNGRHESFQKGPIGQKIEEFFGNLATSGNVTVSEGTSALPQATIATQSRSKSAIKPFGTPPIVMSYDTRFDAASLGSNGLLAWMAVGIDPTAPVAGLGGPSGAYQIPGFAQPAFPAALPSGAAYNLAAAISPNGLNELLDAVTRSGLLAQQGMTKDTVTVGTSTFPLTANVLAAVIPAFKSYPPNEPIVARVTPGPVAPVVSGGRGPNSEPVDLHVPQVRIDLVDSHQQVAIALRADFRVGVDVGISTPAVTPGLQTVPAAIETKTKAVKAPPIAAKVVQPSLVATARRLQVLDFAIVANPINANPADVFRGILCIDHDPNDALPCALGGAIESGLGTVLKTIELPSLADDDPNSPDVTLVPQCIQPQTDGTLVATFGMRLPGDPAPSKVLGLSANLACMAPLTVSGGTGTRGTTGVLATAGTLTAR